MNQINGTEVPDDQLIALPVLAGQTYDFKPPAAAETAPGRVYHLRVPSVASRAAFQRDLNVRCGEYPDDAYLLWALRRAIRDAFDETESAELTAALEQVMGTINDGQGGDDARLAAREIDMRVGRRDKRYAELMAARAYYKAMMPVVVLQHFLIGWTQGPGAFRRARLTDENCISLIPNIEFLQVSTKALELLGTVGALAKN